MKFGRKYIIVIVICVISSGHTPVRQPDKFIGNVKLLKKSLTPHCGVIAWASKQKFEVIEGNIPRGIDNIIFIKNRCPEFFGKDFFKENRLYKVVVSKVHPDSLNYTFLTGNNNTNYPEYWSEKMTIIEIQ